MIVKEFAGCLLRGSECLSICEVLVRGHASLRVFICFNIWVLNESLQDFDVYISVSL